MAKTLYHSRKFLNPKRGIASVEAAINSVEDNYCNAFFEVSDCNRKVSLDFCTYKGDRKEKIRKIELLILELNKFRDAFVETTAHIK